MPGRKRPQPGAVLTRQLTISELPNGPHLTGFLSGAIVLSCLLPAGASLYAATLLTWATALSFQHFRHVLRGPVTAAVQAEATRLSAAGSSDR
jgi:hypothetical protein